MALIATKDCVIEMCPSAADWIMPATIPYYNFTGRSSDGKMGNKADIAKVPVYGGAPVAFAGYAEFTIACKAFVDLTTGRVTTVNITNPGTGYTTAPAVTFSGGGGSGAAATAIINTAGNVVAVIMTNFGTGYTSAPSVSIAAPGAGTTATATSAINEYSDAFDWPLFAAEKIAVRLSPAGAGAVGSKRPYFTGYVVRESVNLDAPVNGAWSFEFQAQGSGSPNRNAY